MSSIDCEPSILCGHLRKTKKMFKQPHELSQMIKDGIIITDENDHIKFFNEKPYNDCIDEKRIECDKKRQDEKAKTGGRRKTSGRRKTRKTGGNRRKTSGNRRKKKHTFASR